jgi:putative alpha-1,2-mannosidase
MASPGYKPKETMLHVPFLLSEIGDPALASWWVRELLQKYYRVARNGLPDNEDMGCQSSFVLGACLGISPVMGQNRYWLTAPVFKESAVPTGLRILCPDASPAARYLVGAVLNGERLTEPWVRHQDLQEGLLLLEVSEKHAPWNRA